MGEQRQSLLLIAKKLRDGVLAAGSSTPEKWVHAGN